MVADEPTTSRSNRALRLTIACRGNDMQVLSSQSVAMQVPASDPTYGFENNAGFWFEVRSDDKVCVYRRVLPDPFTDEIEAPSGDPERPFTRTKTPARERIFVLLVPETEAGRELILCGSPKRAPAGRACAIAAIDLRKPTGRVRMLAATDETPPRPTTKRRSAPKTKRRK